MKFGSTVQTLAAIVGALGLAACAGTAPVAPTAVDTAPTGDRQVLSAEEMPTFEDIVAALPQSLTVAEAAERLIDIDPTMVGELEPPAEQGKYRVQFRGLSGFGGYGGYGGYGGAGIFRYGFPSSYAYGASRYLPYGNFYFPYRLSGGAYRPYLVDRDVIPFYLQRNTYAVPYVSQTQQQVTVPRTAIVQQPVTVPQTVLTQQSVTVPRTITIPVEMNVTVPRTVPRQTTVPRAVTVPVQTTVNVPIVQHGYTQSTSLVTPSGVIPVTYSGR